jgi:hypothetical protein
MAGLAPAIHLPHMTLLVAEKGLAHRVDPDDDDDLSGFSPTLLQHFAMSFAPTIGG